MTTLAVVLMVVAVVLTFVSLGALENSGRHSGTDRSGSRILFGFTLFLRWTCLAVVLGVCAARGGFGWPASTTGQIVLVLAVHMVLGLVSFMSAVLKDMPSPSLSERMVAVMGWVPILLPACQVVIAVTILFPGTLPSTVRSGSLVLMTTVALAAIVVLTAMFVREERQNRAAAPP